MRKLLLVLVGFCISLETSGAQSLLPMNDLYGTMDKAVLEAQIDLTESIGNGNNNPQYQKRLGIIWHNLGVLEVSDAPENALKWLKQAAKSSPDDAEILAYLGSARTMVARDSWNVITKVSQVNKGIGIIDKAIRLSPQNPVVRMVRANNSIALPAFFGRRDKALEDFSYLNENHVALGLKPETAAEICVKLGELLLEDGNDEQAKKLFSNARTMAPNSQWAAQASKHNL